MRQGFSSCHVEKVHYIVPSCMIGDENTVLPITPLFMNKYNEEDGSRILKTVVKKEEEENF
jgi:hypothetical protein